MKEIVLTLILGTATPGGGFPLYGDAFAEMVNAQEPQLRIQPRNTKGSTENVPLLEAGKVDLALVAGEIASAALANSPVTSARSSCPASSSGTFSALPLVLRVSMRRRGSCAFTISANAAP